MKFLAIIVALAATATALPGREQGTAKCTPATYSCSANPKTRQPGWQVCDTTGNWVYAGDCPPKTKCEFLAANGSPYCIPV